MLFGCGGEQGGAQQPIGPASVTSGSAAVPAGPNQSAGGAGGSAGSAAGSAAQGARTGSGGSTASGAAGADAIAGTTGGAAGATVIAGAGGATAAGSGGAGGTGGAGGAAQAGTGGAPGPGAAGAGGTDASSGRVFSQCRFHFGTIADLAKDNPALIAELDYFTPGWMGLGDTFDQQYVCDYVKAGGPFEGKVPVIVAYVSAFYAKRIGNLEDCNASPDPQQTLCVAGAQIITRDLDKVVAIYESYAQGYAGCYGTTKPIVFMMEPDFFQYTISEQSQPWTPQQAGENMGRFVAAIKKHLPNAAFSMDISPWVPPNNGEDHGRQWYSNFDMSQFTFINTSGGGTSAGTAKIRDSNNMTWRGVSEATGKPILADTGYGVNGASAGHDPAWDDPANILARIQDGVVSINQYNPKADWANTIKQLRTQLGEPTRCP